MLCWSFVFLWWRTKKRPIINRYRLATFAIEVSVLFCKWTKRSFIFKIYIPNLFWNWLRLIYGWAMRRWTVIALWESNFKRAAGGASLWTNIIFIVNRNGKGIYTFIMKVVIQFVCIAINWFSIFPICSSGRVCFGFAFFKGGSRPMWSASLSHCGYNWLHLLMLITWRVNSENIEV